MPLHLGAVRLHGGVVARCLAAHPLLAGCLGRVVVLARSLVVVAGRRLAPFVAAARPEQPGEHTWFRQREVGPVRPGQGCGVGAEIQLGKLVVSQQLAGVDPRRPIETAQEDVLEAIDSRRELHVELLGLGSTGRCLLSLPFPLGGLLGCGLRAELPLFLTYLCPRPLLVVVTPHGTPVASPSTVGGSPACSDRPAE